MRKNFFYLLLGILIGSIVALLLAPQSGKKTRRRLSKQARKWQLELETHQEQTFDRFHNWKNSVEEMAEDSIKRLNNNQNAELN